MQMLTGLQFKKKKISKCLNDLFLLRLPEISAFNRLTIKHINILPDPKGSPPTLDPPTPSFSWMKKGVQIGSPVLALWTQPYSSHQTLILLRLPGNLPSLPTDGCRNNSSLWSGIPPQTINSLLSTSTEQGLLWKPSPSLPPAQRTCSKYLLGFLEESGKYSFP